MGISRALETGRLRRRCDPAGFDFATTAELDGRAETIGQDRAQEALRFGVGMPRDGYNIFVMGPQGIGKHAMTKKLLSEVAASEPTPSDWCYVHNFQHPHKPTALELPGGGAHALRLDMESLLEELAAQIPAAFESDEYRSRVQGVEEEIKEKQASGIDSLAHEAEDRGIKLLRTPSGFGFAPVLNGEVIGPDDFSKLDAAEQKEIRDKISALEGSMRDFMQSMLHAGKESRSRIKALSREVAGATVGFAMADSKRKYAEHEAVLAYLHDVEEDVIENVEAFLKSETDASPLSMMLPFSRNPLEKYAVNVLVEHQPQAGAPVVYEDHPTHANLIGRIEQRAQFGALTTDFTLIKPGALHLANGGYLVLDARKLLMQPFAYEALKAAVAAREVRIESLGQLFAVATVSLEPQHIPLDVKIVLLGDRLLYYLLHERDPEFGSLFKVGADFTDRIDRSRESDLQYTRVITRLLRENELRDLDSDAVARVIEQGARQADDADKLSAHIGSLTDLLREADYWAGDAGRDTVTRADVEKAIDKRVFRMDRVRGLVHEQIHRGTVVIRTEGEAVGQVNGLSVLGLGEFRFGQPSRITATARMGHGQVIDIEREVKLGGPSHSKGVLILSNFLAQRYAKERPLSLTASLAFEQSYGGVDGDSASIAETCALLSALAELPVKQSLAITGAISQHGAAQAIGGVNEKIEGFFDICSARGLTGEQGVIIPTSNVKHLMLRPDVVEAAERGKFRVFAVETVDEALELLCGVDAGIANENGVYPEGSIHRRVADRLDELFRLRREAEKREPPDSEEPNRAETEEGSS